MSKDGYWLSCIQASPEPPFQIGGFAFLEGTHHVKACPQISLSLSVAFALVLPLGIVIQRRFPIRSVKSTTQRPRLFDIQAIQSPSLLPGKKPVKPDRESGFRLRLPITGILILPP